MERLDFRVEEGKITEIGVELKAPGTNVIGLEGTYVYPGFIDAHTHVGIMEEKAGGVAGNDTNEISDPALAGIRALDAASPHDPGISSGRNYGFTTVCVLPGSANVIGGEGIVIKTYGTCIDEMLVPTPKKIIKMAFGRNPMGVWSEQKKFPSTRLAVAAVLRRKLHQASNYQKKGEKEFDYEMENLVSLLEGRGVARMHVANLEDIEAVDRVMKEWQIEYVLDHATALHKNPKFAKDLGVPVILGPIHASPRSFQTYDLSFECIPILLSQGILLSLMTDAPVIPLPFARMQLWIADRYRLDRNELMKMITINPAKTLGIDDRVGTIEQGKDADFVIMDGDFFDYRSKILDTYINGDRVGGEADEYPNAL
jgi:imidazolonepropionase-like amidohydrolase